MSGASMKEKSIQKSEGVEAKFGGVPKLIL
jgi:hypothetical protein